MSHAIAALARASTAEISMTPRKPGRLLWPLLANFTRLLIAAGGGGLVLQWGGGLCGVLLAQSVGLGAFGLIITGAIAMGAWGGKMGSSLLHAARVGKG